jgi:hypothetical protein
MSTTCGSNTSSNSPTLFTLACILSPWRSLRTPPSVDGSRKSNLLTLKLKLNMHLARPALTFVTILILPSFLTFVTLLIHRFRMVRAARRERAPEDIVRSLPWRVWTGHGWEKHEGAVPGQDQPVTTPAAAVAPMDVEDGILAHASTSILPPENAADSDDPDEPAWAKTQYECAICLSEFAVGDRVRVLPCAHIFHMDEVRTCSARCAVRTLRGTISQVDGWLINNKKLVRPLNCLEWTSALICLVQCPVCKADVTQAPASAVEQGPEAGSSTESTELLPTERTPLLPHAASADEGRSS